jgi:hypothetical protein
MTVLRTRGEVSSCRVGEVCVDLPDASHASRPRPARPTRGCVQVCGVCHEFRVDVGSCHRRASGLRTLQASPRAGRGAMRVFPARFARGWVPRVRRFRALRDGGGATQMATEQSFDLSHASARLDPFTRRSRYVSEFLMCFLVVLGLVVVAFDWRGIVSRSLDSYQLFGLIVLLVVVVFGLGVTLPLLARQKKGATGLRVTDQEFDVIYGEGRHELRSWSDPGLHFELIDFSGADPSVLPTADFPHQLSLNGRMSLLTEGAFSAILEQVARHGLVDRVVAGGTWRFPARANPVVHHVHAVGTGPPGSAR